MSDDMIGRLHPIARVRDNQTLESFGKELRDNPSNTLRQPCASH